MGADRAIHVNDPEAETSDALGVAKILAAIAKAESPDIVFTGLMADDGNSAAVPPMLAELIDVPSATGVVHTELKDGALTVERELEGGALEVVELPTPCLVAIQTGANQVRYASLKGIMQAKKKPVDVKTAADLGVSGQVGAAHAKVLRDKVYQPPKADRAEILTGTHRRDRCRARRQDQGARPPLAQPAGAARAGRRKSRQAKNGRSASPRGGRRRRRSDGQHPRRHGDPERQDPRGQLRAG